MSPFARYAPTGHKLRIEQNPRCPPGGHLGFWVALVLERNLLADPNHKTNFRSIGASVFELFDMVRRLSDLPWQNKQKLVTKVTIDFNDYNYNNTKLQNRFLLSFFCVAIRSHHR
jgi:hypothetical protein